MAEILCSRKGDAAVVTISNESRRNAMTFEMWGQLASTVSHLDESDAAAIVVCGAGTYAFCAGADISELRSLRYGPEATASYDNAIATVEQAIAGSHKPTIAMIRGVFAGGGAAIALACDLRFAANDLSFAIPAARLGAVYPAQTVRRLVQIVGASMAFDLLASARTIGADEAFNARLVDRVAPADDLETFALNYVAEIAGHAPLSIRAAKLAVRSALAPDDAALRDELRHIEHEAAGSDAYLEGMRAFLDKRQSG